MNTSKFSLHCRNLDKTAMNIAGSNLEAVARPWFSEMVDPRIDRALRDLNQGGRRRAAALDYLGLELLADAA